MTSHLEVLSPIGEWREVKKLFPGETSTFTNYLPDEGQELYSFTCSQDDTFTQIRKLVDPGQVRLTHDKTFVPHSDNWEDMRTLTQGEEFRLPITIQRGQEVEVRVVHRTR